MSKPKREFILPPNLQGEAADGYRDGCQDRMKGNDHDDKGRRGDYAAGYDQGYNDAEENQEEDDDWREQVAPNQ